MRIDAHIQISQVYNADQAKRSQRSGNRERTDMLEISEFGKEYHIAKQAVKNVPDVREDKISEIKRQLAEGTYNVSIEDVAGKLAKLLGE